MGFFDDCRLDQRYSSDLKGYRFGRTYWTVLDWDQRRTITVCMSWDEEDEDFVFEALDDLDDDVPADAVEIEISDKGELLSSSSEPGRDGTLIPFYPSATEFSPELRRVRRTELTEIDRLGIQVDLTTYEYQGQTKQVVFKYYLNESSVPTFWHEMNCVIHIPKHPNIVPLDCLVTDNIDCNDLVVGFTTTFIPGGTIEGNISRVFKLKYLKQLTEVIDYINLRLGLIHGDICLWNLLINSETDNLQIFDFNLAAKLGWEGDTKHNDTFCYDEARNDVKLVVFTVYEIITRDQQFRDSYPIKADKSEVLEMDVWKQHKEVRLDSPLSEYRQVLKEWVNIRKMDEITHYTQTPDAIDWPLVPEFPLVPSAGDMVREQAQMRQEMIKRGANFLRWQRIGSYFLPLPPGQRLLATGEIVYDGGGGKDGVNSAKVGEDSLENEKV